MPYRLMTLNRITYEEYPVAEFTSWHDAVAAKKEANKAAAEALSLDRLIDEPYWVEWDRD